MRAVQKQSNRNCLRSRPAARQLFSSNVMRPAEFAIILLPPLVFYGAIFLWMHKYSGKKFVGFSLLEFVLLIIVAGGLALFVETRADATADFVRGHLIPTYVAGHVIASVFLARWLEPRRFFAIMTGPALALIAMAGCGSFTLWLAIAFKIWKVV